MQDKLFFEDELDAARTAVQALGGAKQVGPKLWPDKSPEAAARQMLDCLNPNRADRLSPSQLLLLMRLSRESGFHGLAEYFMSEAGYSRPLPVDPKDEATALMPRMDDLVGQAGQLASRLERLRNIGGLKAVG